mgnify:CR=1 FL=1
MRGIKCIFVEKKDGFNIEANSLLEDFKNNLRIKNLQAVRVVNKYILDEMNEENYKKSLYTIFAEKTVDNLYEESFPISPDEIVFAVEFLPGQYDQRADSASKCIGLVGAEENVEVKTAKVIVLKGKLTKEDIEKIKSYYINPVDSREVSLSNKELYSKLSEPKDVEILYDFVKKDKKEIEKFHKELGLAMSVDDLLMIRDYFKSEERIPTITEIKVIDTYWSDHCRHTTFSTSIEDIKFEKGKLNNAVQKSYESYLKSRDFVYEKNNKDKTLMDIAVIAMKEMRKRGMLDDLDISEEINACSIKVNIETNNGIEEYLVMFKNETHNHPTEIEPFGGAATCLGGAIRDPLSGRTYVYQAMRVTGAADPTVPVEETLKGKLPQRTITLGAAHGYSSYGNQIGLATGQVSEVYHPNYVAKRMEIGAVIAAAPSKNVIREEPKAGDIVILLGGRTGRDGVGGATGSSKGHTEESINKCGAEVQKGNPPTERKIQRLFRNPKVAEAVNEFLTKQDGLMLGICNGFQALIKLGLVPYGEIRETSVDAPTLTYNNIGRHQSKIVRTRIASNKSPWLKATEVGDTHSIAISHGEGKFVASEEVMRQLIANGQIATQYVDFNDNATYDIDFNPNGSTYAVEGITSADGRILGKMGHSERIGENLYRNVPGEFDQKIFKSGVNYFRK